MSGASRVSVVFDLSTTETEHPMKDRCLSMISLVERKVKILSSRGTKK